MGRGVPEDAIIAETESRNTEESARRIAVIARANGLHRLVIVSDATHLFRIHEICAADGLDVLTSPRPRVAMRKLRSKPRASPTRSSATPPGASACIPATCSHCYTRRDLGASGPSLSGTGDLEPDRLCPIHRGLIAMVGASC